MNEELGCCTVSQRGRETGTAPRGTASAGGRRCVHACARVPARLWLTSPGSGVKAGVSPPACHLQLGQQAHSDDVLYLVASNRASKRNCCLILKGSSRFPSASLLFFFFSPQPALPHAHLFAEHTERRRFCTCTRTYSFPGWRKASGLELQTSVYVQRKQPACRFLQPCLL